MLKMYCNNCTPLLLCFFQLKAASSHPFTAGGTPTIYIEGHGTQLTKVNLWSHSSLSGATQLVTIQRSTHHSPWLCTAQLIQRPMEPLIKSQVKIIIVIFIIVIIVVVVIVSVVACCFFVVVICTPSIGHLLASLIIGNHIVSHFIIKIHIRK